MENNSPDKKIIPYTEEDWIRDNRAFYDKCGTSREKQDEFMKKDLICLNGEEAVLWRKRMGIKIY